MSDEGDVPRLTNLAESMGMEITEFVRACVWWSLPSARCT